MKLALTLPLFSGDTDRLLRIARGAEDAGFSGVFVFDHLFPPGGPSDKPALEAFASLAAVVAATERLTVGTLVTRVSLRPTGYLAKLGAWLDSASGGRLVLGLGTGDPIDRMEHQTYGIPMPNKRDRRRLLEETTVALKALFEGRAYPGGELVPRLDGPLRPPPARAGGPPIWLGAQADEVVRMAARVADGWNGWGLDPEAFGAKARLLLDEAASLGRQVEPTWAGIVLVGADDAEAARLLEARRARGMSDDVWVGSADAFVRFLEELADAGATWASFVVAGPADRRELIAERVLPALASRAVAE